VFKRREIAKLREKEEFLELRRVIIENRDVYPAQLVKEFYISMELVVKIQSIVKKQ
jgi:hypothetical protein